MTRLTKNIVDLIIKEANERYGFPDQTPGFFYPDTELIVYGKLSESQIKWREKVAFICKKIGECSNG